MKYGVYCIAFIVILLSACNRQDDPSLDKISKKDAVTDFELFYSILKKAHPSLYVYTPKQKLDALIDSLQNNITDDETLLSLYNKMICVANEIGCSHTSVSMPEYVYDTLQNRDFFFPYPVKWVEDKLLVNTVGYDLPEGTEIRYINNEPVAKVMQQLMPYNAVEGNHRHTQQILAGDNFSMEYFYRYGKCEKFMLRYTDTSGIDQFVTKKPISLSEWNNREANKYYYDRTEADYDLTVYPDKKYAYMRIATFEINEGQKQTAYENFCYNSFELLKNKKDIQTLIIDLRENTGGILYNAFLLYSFLTNEPFKEYKKVAAMIDQVPYAKFLDPAFIANDQTAVNEKLSEKFIQQRNNIHIIPDSMLNTWEPDRFHYNGNVVIVTNSNVVSAASYFALMVKNSNRGKIVGEETSGGTFSGNGFTGLKYILPHSKMRFEFPYAHFIYSYKSAQNKGTGLIPDYYIPDTQQSFKENTDIQLGFIIDSLILNKKHS